MKNLRKTLTWLLEVVDADGFIVTEGFFSGGGAHLSSTTSSSITRLFPPNTDLDNRTKVNVKISYYRWQNVIIFTISTLFYMKTKFDFTKRCI